jgi:hemerythrin-like domain-containing protein
MVEPEAIIDPFKKLVECHDQILKHLQTFEDALNDLEQNGIHAFKRERENIRETFGFFQADVALHTRDEEDGLFPLLEPKLQRRPVLNPHFERTPIQAIEEQHRKAEAETQRLEILHSKLGAESDEARCVLLIAEFVKRGRVLIAFYREHIRGENEAIFPLAERILTGDEKAHVARVMNTHRGSVDPKLVS